MASMLARKGLGLSTLARRLAVLPRIASQRCQSGAPVATPENVTAINTSSDFKKVKFTIEEPSVAELGNDILQGRRLYKRLPFQKPVSLLRFLKEY